MATLQKDDVGNVAILPPQAANGYRLEATRRRERIGRLPHRDGIAIFEAPARGNRAYS